MSDFSSRSLALVYCAALMLSAYGCSDESASSVPEAKCGDQVCGPDQVCEDGVCKDQESGSEEPGEPEGPGTEVEDPCKACTSDQICENGTCKDKPVDPCAACTENQKCEGNQCIDLCGGAVCLEHQKCDEATQTCINDVVVEDPCDACTETQECINNECVEKDPCATKTCPDNFRCDSSKGGECVEIDPCEAVVCGDAQICINARCVDEACMENGVEKTCGEGMTCSKGECVEDGCLGIACEEGWQCIKGICEETVCLNYFCEEGRTCRGGVCVDNECLDMACDEGMVCSKGTCTYTACLDKEPCTTGKMCNAEGACVFIDAPAISIDEPEDKSSDETGKTVSLSLHLNNAPTQDVRMTCEVVTESPNPEVEVTCGDIVFNTENWQLPQTIIVTGIEDYLKDGDQTYKIKVTTVSEDAEFTGLVTESVELTNVDTTTPGFTFSATTLTTYEDPSQPAATYTISLNSKPSATVSLASLSTNNNEGKVSPITVRFTQENWNQPQTVTVQGVDDIVLDGNIYYTIIFSPSESDDKDYHNIQPAPIKVTNIDNDVAGLNINIPEDYSVVENQSNALLVKLNTPPKNAVTIQMSIDDATEAEFNTKEIVIEPENWNVGKEIIISGLPDDMIDGDQPIKMSFTVTSEDKDYQLEAPVVYEGTVIDNDSAEIVTMLGESPIVKEGSADFVTLSLQLSSKPTQSVSIALSVTDSSEVKINKKSININPEHWDMPIDVLVSSVDDDILDGDIKSKLVMTMTSADTNFNNTKEIEFTTVDDDKAGYIIHSNAASFPENSGATTSMTIALLSQPVADVKVNVSSSDASELTVTSANVLTFTEANWNKPQTVNVKVADDNIADGTLTAHVKFVATSTDKNFNGATGRSADYTIIDNEAPSLVLTTDVTTVPQASPTATAYVQLGVQPSSNVTVTMATTDSKIMQFAPASVTFTTSDWDKPKPITITADFEAIATASANATISATASGDSIYASIVSNKINLNFVKVPEIQDFTFTESVQTVNLPKGRYKLEVWGGQGGNHNNGIGGKGGYSTGILNLANSATIYIQVAGKGATNAGGYNGGGGTANTDGAGGGGATHMAVNSGLLSTFSSTYKSDVYIVAGGGGGGATNGNSTGGYGGGTSGGTGAYSSCGIWGVGGTGGTQTAGGVLGSNRSDDSNGTNGSFGQGGTGSKVVNSGGGGGGGLYGGGGGEGGNTCNAAGGGGSGYLNPSLTSAQTLTGNVSFPSPKGSTEVGHTGYGHARITLVR